MKTKQRRIHSLLLAALLCVGAVSCGDDDDSSSNTAPPPNQPGGTQQVTIHIQPGAMNMGSNAFGTNPMRIAPGTTVTWINDDSLPHTATSGSGAFDSEIINPGEQFAHTFTDAGNFPYFCEVHPSMTGMIIVGSGTGTGGSTTTTMPSSTTTTTGPSSSTTTSTTTFTTTTTGMIR
jgi:plastocyanin